MDTEKPQLKGEGEEGEIDESQQHEEVLQTWVEDGTPKTQIGESCDKNPKRRLRGPMVLSKEKGAVVMGFGLSYHSMFEVLKEKEAAEEEVITDPIEIEYRKATAAAAAKAAEEKKKQGPTPTAAGGSGGSDLLPMPLTVKYPLEQAQLARVGALADQKFGDRKCYCERVALRHARPNRLEEQNGQALACRRSMASSHKQEQDRFREMELSLLCREKHGLSDGNYCSW
jgi:hypothetical protein